MTYGEAHIFVLLSDWVVEGNKTRSIPVPDHIPRMKPDEAAAYYNKKIATEFKRLGYEKKVKSVQAVEIIQELEEEEQDFLCVISDFEINFPSLLKEVRDETNKMIRREALKISRIIND